MPEYLILKLEGDDPRDASIVTSVVSDEEDLTKVIKQGYTDDGRYAIVDWSERLESDLEQGPVKVKGVEDAEKRAEGEAGE